ncbi:hypothetical protein U27_00920 [Candidatus Vecturithrix granuli]|uniref:Uncharacterized protein n=1 Tax=Vecturithrix granuli TaxID=1499967 RepID=A0A081C8W7_VECG1|nr:hypothetical protein U27_00920 [Candidatus Vecturithrix granuli]
MSKEAIHPDFHDFPCGNLCHENCTIREEIIRLQQHLVPLPQDASYKLIHAFFQSYRELLCHSSKRTRTHYAPSFALPALFDLVVSAKYAAKMLSDGGWVYCAGEDTSGQSALYFPFLNTCPRCSVQRGLKPLVKSNKPQSAIIGDIASDTTLQILSVVLNQINPSVKIGKNSDRQADVDFVIYDQHLLALGEIKSSPLVIYPLAIALERPMTEVRNGGSIAKRDHTQATTDIMTANIAFYLPHRAQRIKLGGYNTTDWPYHALTNYLSNSKHVALFIAAWKELYEVYLGTAEKTENQRHIDNRRWLLCGCGGKVDDSKNAPGMDRTDDIKKGLYQVLKFGAYYKDQCPLRRLRAVLSSNFFPHRKFDHYLKDMHDVLLTRERYSITLRGKNDKEKIAFHKHNLFYLYDALLCFTRSLYNDQHLQDITSLENFMDAFCV